MTQYKDCSGASGDDSGFFAAQQLDMIAQLRVDLDRMRAQLSGCETCLKLQRDETRELEQSLSRVTEEREAWKRAAESQNRQWSAKCTELTETRAELETARADIARMTESRNTSEHSRIVAERQRDAARDTLARVTEERDRLQNGLNRTSAKLFASEAETVRLRGRAARAQYELRCWREFGNAEYVKRADRALTSDPESNKESIE